MNRQTLILPSGAFALALVALCAACGCASSYSWTSSVPQEMRTVAVPTFRNESEVSEVGAIASRQLLREFQREGTFGIRPVGDAALEVQGVVKSASGSIVASDLKTGMRVSAGRASAMVVISVIDKRRGEVLIDNRAYTATADFTSTQDQTTGLRNVSGALMQDLARQVVDDLLGLKW